MGISWNQRLSYCYPWFNNPNMTISGFNWFHARLVSSSVPAGFPNHGEVMVKSPHAGGGTLWLTKHECKYIPGGAMSPSVLSNDYTYIYICNISIYYRLAYTLYIYIYIRVLPSCHITVQLCILVVFSTHRKTSVKCDYHHRVEKKQHLTVIICDIPSSCIQMSIYKYIYR